MTRVVGIELRQPGKVYYFRPNGLQLSSSDRVMVNTSRGMESGTVIQEETDIADSELVKPVKKIVRRVNEDDQKTLDENRAKEEEAYHIVQKKVEKHGLDMHLVRVEMSFDRSKMTFYFTAENRVDFRELVKDMAGEFKVRIDLRQIGVRDKAKMIGGLGHCGQRLCCTVFLSDLNPVSIKMAKEQYLPLNPHKISGVCGRLMCCLRYEVAAYKDFNKRAPKKGAIVETLEGESGRVVELNCLKERVTLEDDERHYRDVPLTEIKSCGKGCCNMVDAAEGEIEAAAEELDVDINES